jgi:hypothetical protein
VLTNGASIGDFEKNETVEVSEIENAVALKATKNKGKLESNSKNSQNILKKNRRLIL